VKKVSHYLCLWDLTLEEPPLETKTSLVAFVKWKNRPCLLKISLEEGNEKTASVLKHYDGQGAVKLLKEEGTASLLERCRPGAPLSRLFIKGEDDQATKILCDIIEKLHKNKSFTGNYQSIADLKESFASYLESEDTVIPLNLVREANTLYGSLVKTQGVPILLHGDLHHDNVLLDEKRGWLAIDPKGYVGEPCYEVGAMLRNPLNNSNLHQNPDLLERRVKIICERLGFAKSRVMGWAFSQAVLSAIWSVEENESPEWFLKVALGMHKILKS
jgi:streptomycin 6-kinase